MWHSSKRFLIVGSVALNFAFVGVWLAHAIPAVLDKEDASVPPQAMGRIWCPLHQQLNVSDEQWEQIEPRLKEFRESAQSVCRQVNKLRQEMLEMIEASTPDREAIAAKQKEIQAGQRKMQGLVIGHLLAEKEILTPGQEERLFAIIREHSGGPMRGGIGRVLRDGSQSP
ncbi:MAG: periplasmic heavy metal sensor [Planctomycetota bacterium]|nr:periplasmic heavy metal sensor [Planctomycetota bacterium]